MNVTDTDSSTDQIAVREKFVSVTPIHYDLTDLKMLEQLRGWGLERLH
jgi:broad specificity polyphosphatase/5'/3'-nucleotidase SurE